MSLDPDENTAGNLTCGTEKVVNSTNRITVIQDSIISFAPKPFALEADESKVELVLKWINTGDCEDILSGNKKVQNMRMLLEGMAFNGYLRILKDVEPNLIKNYLSSTSWSSFERFRKEHEDDKVICPYCKNCFDQNKTFWKCCRCLFYFHTTCAAPKRLRTKDDIYEMCVKCAFNM